MKNTFAILHRQLLMAIVFLIPIYIKWVPILIVLFVLSSINEIVRNRSAIQRINRSRLLGLIAFFIILILGVTWSLNTKYALRDLEIKLSLLIFPLIFALLPLRVSSFDVFRSFVFGAVAGALMRWFYSIVNYLSVGELLWYKDFSRDIHPSYLSMYLVFALILLIYISNGIKVYKKYLILVTLSIGLILMISVFALSSKLGMLSSLIPFTYFLILLFKKIKSKLVLISIMVFCLMIVWVAFNSNDRFRIFMDSNPMTTESSTDSRKSIESTAVRTQIWSSGLIVCKNNVWFGVGTGDVKDELISQYQRDGLTGAADNKLNAHNQFLQIWVAVGLVGLLALLLQFFIPLLISIQHKNVVLLLFLLLCFANFMVESMLETQAGTIFFGLFNSYLCFNPLRK